MISGDGRRDGSLASTACADVAITVEARALEDPRKVSGRCGAREEDLSPVGGNHLPPRPASGRATPFSFAQAWAAPSFCRLQAPRVC